MKNIVLISIICLLSFPSFAQQQNTVYTACSSGVCSVGIGTTSPNSGTAIDMGSMTGAVLLPVGTTGQEPSGVVGMLRYNSTTNAFEGYQGSTPTWGSLGSSSISNSGQLQRHDNTHLYYCPYRGNIKTIAASGSYTIPSACLQATTTSMYVGGNSGQALVAGTLYYIYIKNVSGTEILNASTTGHVTDATNGVEEMSGDTTQTLVGMVYPQSGAVLTDSLSARLVASWDNRIPKPIYIATPSSVTTTSTTVVELTSSLRTPFLTWGDGFTAAYTGVVDTSTATGETTTQLGLDGVSTLLAGTGIQETGTVTSADANCSISAYASATEGKHYITLGGFVSAGTGSWLASTATTKGIFQMGTI